MPIRNRVRRRRCIPELNLPDWASLCDLSPRFICRMMIMVMYDAATWETILLLRKVIHCVIFTEKTYSTRRSISGQIVWLDWLCSMMFHYLAHLLCHLCQFPSTQEEQGRSPQTNTQNQSQPNLAIRPDGPPCNPLNAIDESHKCSLFHIMY